MVETNVTELLSLQTLLNRLISGEPVQYPVAKKFGLLMALVAQYASMVSKYKTEEQSTELTALLNQAVETDITFSEEELSNINMTPLEAYVMNKFVK